MDANSRPDSIPLFRELRKPYFLFRTPDNLGSYLQREIHRALFSRKEPLARFLVTAQLSGPQVKPPKVEYALEGHAAEEYVRMKHLSRAEIAAFAAAAEEFLAKASPDAAERITPHECELRAHFRLPDPREEPDAYWLHGPPHDRKLFILWGCEFRQNTSLPLAPGKGTAPGETIVDRLRACATPWSGLQAQALELLRSGKEPLGAFLAQPVLDAKGQLKAVKIAGRELPAASVSIPRYIPAGDLRRLAASAGAFYAKAHADDASTSAFEKELRAALRFPDPSRKPAAYVLVKTDQGRRLHVLLDGSETFADTAPIVRDDALDAGDAAAPAPVVDQLRSRLAPRRTFIAAGAGLAAAAAVAIWLSGVLVPKTPPKLAGVSAENTPTQVRATFTEAIDPATFYSAEEIAAKEKPGPVGPRRNFLLKDADGERVEITAIAASPTDPKQVVLTTARLDDIKDYTLAVQGVKDRHGNAIAADQQARVNYLDTLPPKLAGDPSADGADSRKIVVKFNEPLDDRYSRIPANFSIPGYILTKVDPAPDSPDTLVLTANNPFKSGERYSLTVSGVTDRARRPNSLREPITVEFPYIDNVAPQVRAVSAEKSQVEAQVVFSEPVQKGAAETPGNYVFSAPGQPDATAVSAKLLDDLTTVQLRTSPLANGKDYTLKVLNIEDRATPPNKLAANTAVKFAYTGKPDFDPPTIADISVRGDGQRITVAFNKALDAAIAADAGHYRLDDPTVKIVQVAPKPNDPKAVVLTPDQPLQETKTYRLTVTGVADTIGNVANQLTSKAFAGPGLSISQVDVLGVATVETAPDGRTVTVTFTDEVDRTSATNRASYAIGGGVGIAEVLFNDNFRQVQLKLAAGLLAQRYSLTIRNVGLRSDPAKVQREIVQNFNGPGARGLGL